MKIILVRHYKVDIEHKTWLNSSEYEQDCNDYNISPIIDQEPPELPEYRLYASSMSRAQETARLATGREAEVIDDVYEVTFNGFLSDNIKLPFLLWELIARIQWYFNISAQRESLDGTKERLKRAGQFLIERDEDCIVVMHSIAMKVFSRILIKKGFKGPKIYFPKNGQAFVFKKD